MPSKWLSALTCALPKYICFPAYEQFDRTSYGDAFASSAAFIWFNVSLGKGWLLWLVVLQFPDKSAKKWSNK